jgi:hypothetical protein
MAYSFTLYEKKNSMIRILTAALLGTSAMTAVSYAISRKKNKQFREPDLLAKLLNRMIPDLEKRNAQLSGWLIHYGVGLLFSAIYDRVWAKAKMDPTLRSGLLLGGISGAAGALVWKTIFTLHPHPPANDRENFYGHLITAHLIFGAGAVAGYHLGERLSNKSSGRKHLPEDLKKSKSGSLILNSP